MIGSKKKSTSKGLEVIYANNLPEDLLHALESFYQGKPVLSEAESYETYTQEQRYPVIMPMDVPVAAVLTNPKFDLLFVRWHLTPRTDLPWRPVARFKPETLGSHTAIVGEPYREAQNKVHQELLTALKTTDEAEFSKWTGNKVKLESAAWQIKGRTRVPWIRYRGLWFAVAPAAAPIISKNAANRRAEYARLRAQGAPDINIV